MKGSSIIKTQCISWTTHCQYKNCMVDKLQCKDNRVVGNVGRYVASLIMLRVWREVGCGTLPTPPKD